MTITVIGEAVVDLVYTGAGRYQAVPGGSPANVAVALARLGVPVRLAARLSSDPPGEVLRRHLAQNGVDTSALVEAREPASLALVHTDADGQPAYDLRIHDTADWQWTTPELDRLLHQGTNTLHIGSLAAVLPPGADAIARFVREAQPTATISYDPNVRAAAMDPIPGARERVEELLDLADIIKISDQDLGWLRPHASSEEFIAERLAHGTAVACVTLGAKGALAGTMAAGVLSIPAYPVSVVDAVGAGDTYVGAILAGLHHRDLLGPNRRPALRSLPANTLRDVLGTAAYAAALTCTRPGADPPTALELAVA